MLISAFFLTMILISIVDRASLSYNSHKLYLCIFLGILFWISTVLFFKSLVIVLFKSSNFFRNIIFVSMEYVIMLFLFLIFTLIVLGIFIIIYGGDTELSRTYFLFAFIIGSFFTCLFTILFHSKFVEKYSKSVERYFKNIKKLDTQILEKIFDILSIIVTIILLMNSTYSSISSYDKNTEVPKSLDKISEYTLFIYTIPIYIITIAYKILDICSLNKKTPDHQKRR